MSTAVDLNKLVMELREKTGAGMMDCKKALAAANGDVAAAITELRKKGMADASKKAGRATKEGAVAFSGSPKAGALVELNCETDFVGRSDDFQGLAVELAKKAASGEIGTPEDAAALVQPVFQKVRENLMLRRLVRYEAAAGLVAGYVHSPEGRSTGKSGALIELSAPSAEAPGVAEAAKELLLQIVAAKPTYLDRSAVPAADVEKEKEIYTEQLKKEGKPDAAIPKILEGKLNKLFFQQHCLLDQLLLRDGKTPIAQLLKDASAKAGGPVSVKRFVRYQLGE